MEKETKQSTSGLSAMASGHIIESRTQVYKYHTKGGHGFAAEDANAMADRFLHESVEMSGRSNVLNGPDRITDGLPIQTKYHRTAAKSVASTFDSQTGNFRYPNQRIEVPSDQYHEAIEEMRKAIIKGKVSGVTDPNEATNIIIKGRYSLAEAHKIAKAANLESIKFDLQTQAAACAFAGGISSGISFVTAVYNGDDFGEALKKALKSGASAGTTALLSGVVAQQFLRTSAGRSCAAATTHVTKALVKTGMQSQIGKAAITKVASGIAGKSVSGAAAANVLTKACRTNVVTGAAVLAVTTIPDAVRACRGKITWGEFTENTACNVGGIGGGMAGASTGAAIGSFICPGIGTAIGGIVGGIVGGIGSSCVVRGIINLFK